MSCKKEFHLAEELTNYHDIIRVPCSADFSTRSGIELGRSAAEAEAEACVCMCM